MKSFGMSHAALLTMISVVVGAFGIAASYYGTPEPPAPDDRKTFEIEKKGKELLEAWKSGS